MEPIFHAFSIAGKELQLISKDRGWLVTLFLMPLLFGSLIVGINQMVEGDGETPAILLDAGLVNQDTGVFGQEVAKAIQGIQELNLTIYESVAEAQEPVAQGEAAAAIIIPADFSEKIDAYTPTSVEVIVDPAEPESASIVTGIMNHVVAEVTIWGEIQYGIRSVLAESGLLDGASPQELRAFEAQNLGVLMTQLGEMRQNPAIAVVSEQLGGEQIEKGGPNQFLIFVFPAFTVMFIFFVVGMAAQALVTEREAGTLRRLLAAPISSGSIVAGKMLAYMVIPCLQVLLMFALANIVFDMPLGRSPLALVVVTLVVSLVATALGMMVAALAKTAKQASDLGVMAALILAAIGGAMPLSFPPVFRMEGAIGIISRLTPQAHAAEAFFMLTGENAVLANVLPQLGVLLAMAAVFFAIAVWRFRYE